MDSINRQQRKNLETYRVVPNGWIEHMVRGCDPPQEIIDELEARKLEVQETAYFKSRAKRLEEEYRQPVIPQVRSWSARRSKGGRNE